MALGDERALPSSFPPMDTSGCSRRWKTRIPEFIRRGTGPTSIQNLENTGRDGENSRDKERGGARKSVTMARTSRYLTDRRQYTLRKPLSVTEHQTSILKKSQEQSEQWGCSITEEHNANPHQHRTKTDFNTKQAAEEIPGFSLDPSHTDTSPHLASREDFSTHLGVSDRGTWRSLEEPAFGTPYQGTSLSPRSLSSPPLEVRKLSPLLSPRFSSTLLSPPSYSPPIRPSRPRHTEYKLVGGQARLDAACSTGYSKSRGPPTLHIISPHQANYWACAIPRSMPPSPDRGSPAWDPDKEYQALLDYTYPLRPGRVVSGWETSELGSTSLLQKEPGLQDSGIELDGPCSSTSLSALDFSLSDTLGVGTMWPREKGFLGTVQRLSEPRRLSHSKSSDGILSCSPFSSADPIGLSLESLNCIKDRSGLNQSACGGGGHYRKTGVFSTSSNIIRTTSVLPRLGSLKGGDWDEEFWPLPERLEELQVLSRQVREVTAQLDQPVTASWESLDRGATSPHSSTTLPEKQEEEEEEPRKEVFEKEDIKDMDGSEERQSKEIHGRDSLRATQGSAPRLDQRDGGMCRANLREVEAMVEQLMGLTLPESHIQNQGENEHVDSLMQHIHTFCSNLEELIRWLYSVVEKMEVLAPPRVDIDSVKSSLADYKNFQREVTAHQPLTTSVLQTGELLLNCMTSTSPVLKDTLSLIERQSQALETHTEHLFSSILSAMDSLTEPGLPIQPAQPGDSQPCG